MAPSNVAATGVDDANLVKQLQLYLTVAFGVAVFLAVCYALSKLPFDCGSFKDMLKKVIKSIIDSTFWNGIIQASYIGFIDYCLMAQVSFSIYRSSGNTADLIQAIIIWLLLLAYIFTLAKIISDNKEKLLTKKFLRSYNTLF